MKRETLTLIEVSIKTFNNKTFMQTTKYINMKKLFFTIAAIAAIACWLMPAGEDNPLPFIVAISSFLYGLNLHFNNPNNN